MLQPTSDHWSSSSSAEQTGSEGLLGSFIATIIFIVVLFIVLGRRAGRSLKCWATCRVGKRQQGASLSALHPCSGEVGIRISQNPGGRDGEQMSWRLISGGRQHEAMLCTALVFLHLQYFSSSFQLNQSLSNFQGLQNRGNPYVTHLQSFVSYPLTNPAPESQPCPNINRTIRQYGRGRAALDEGGEWLIRGGLTGKHVFILGGQHPSPQIFAGMLNYR